MQYTIRNIPKHLDSALRSSARRQGKSLNDVTIEALSLGAGVNGAAIRHRDLTGIAGSWREDPEFHAAIAEQDTIDEAMWR
jgi:plasmid stability protein